MPPFTRADVGTKNVGGVRTEFTDEEKDAFLVEWNKPPIPVGEIVLSPADELEILLNRPANRPTDIERGEQQQRKRDRREA